MANKREVKKYKKTDKNLEIEKESRYQADYKEIKKEDKKKQNIQIMWAIILMSSVILIIVLVPFIVENFVNKFAYIDLDWQKTKLGDLIFYSIRIPIVDIQGMDIISVSGKTVSVTSTYSMNFRNDPRKLDYIKTYLLIDNLITFKKDKIVYIALYPEMEACEDNSIALINLAGFLRDFGGLNVKSAVSKLDYAEKNNLPYITCNNAPNNTVIFINSGRESRISKINDNCYELIYNNCEIIPVTEKFMLIILEDYMSFFVKEDKSFLDIFK